MTRARSRSRWFAIACVVVALAPLPTPAAAHTGTGLVVLFFVVDDADWRLISPDADEAYSIPTGESFPSIPTIDTYRANGAMFHHFQVSPFCGPTRTAFLSGRSTRYTGTFGPGAAGFDGDSEFTFFEGARAIGYKTALFGKLGIGEYGDTGAYGLGALQSHLGIETFDGFPGAVLTGSSYEWKRSRVISGAIVEDGVDEEIYHDEYIADAAGAYIDSLSPSDAAVVMVAFEGLHSQMEQPPGGSCGTNESYACVKEIVEYTATRIQLVVDRAVLKWGSANVVSIIASDDGSIDYGQVLIKPGGEDVGAKGWSHESGSNTGFIVSGDALHASMKNVSSDLGFSELDIRATLLEIIGAAGTVPPSFPDLAGDDRYVGQARVELGHSMWTLLTTGSLGSGESAHGVTVINGANSFVGRGEKWKCWTQAGSVYPLFSDMRCFDMDACGQENFTVSNAACEDSTGKNACDAYFAALGGADDVWYQGFVAEVERLHDEIQPPMRDVTACGNGVVEVGMGEECDDGNTISEDGCSWMCTIESCGDGTLQAGLGEACDDGNLVSEDGCSSACLDEFCSDGIVEIGLGEACDDGNLVSEDGCSSVCTIESCGDGSIQAGLGETCDDGNMVGGDGCDAMCATETSVCGNGTVEAEEACDDGNLIAEDGCSSVCTIEFCGDGTIQAGLGETCDDGNAVADDGCDDLCEIEFDVCGNGILESGEECDDGNHVMFDSCSNGCLVTTMLPASSPIGAIALMSSLAAIGHLCSARPGSPRGMER